MRIGHDDVREPTAQVSVLKFRVIFRPSELRRAACPTSCHLGFVSDSCHLFPVPNWVSQSFRDVCRMSAVSQYCDRFFRGALLRRNDRGAHPMPWVRVCDVSNVVYFDAASPVRQAILVGGPVHK
jgi:hypothetical protein